MADVFISYHEESAGKLAQQIAETFEKAGISCWYAKRDIHVGGDFAYEIPQQISTCKLFLLLLNEGASQSEHVGNELALAFSRYNGQKDIQIIPLKIGEYQKTDWVSYYLIRKQIALFPAQPDTQQLKRLLKRVEKLLNREPQSKIQAKIIDTGKCGDNVIYTLDESGQLVISGFGPMWDNMWVYTKTIHAPWYPKRQIISSVSIQNGVSSVACSAFECCVNLKSINIPDSVSSIGEDAFRDCDNLKSALVPANAMIGVGAFDSDTKVTRRIPK